MAKVIIVLEDRLDDDGLEMCLHSNFTFQPVIDNSANLTQAQGMACLLIGLIKELADNEGVKLLNPEII